MSALRSYSLAEVLTPLTVAEVETSIYAVLAALGMRTAGWKTGGVARAIVTAAAIVIATWTKLTTSIARMGFAEHATGVELTAFARYERGLDRFDATFASGNVTINNTGGGVYDFGIGDLVVRRSTDGATYVNTSLVEIGTLQTNVPVPVRATVAGSASSALPGEISGFETTYLGLTVTNPLALTGIDEETDTELQIRCAESVAGRGSCGHRDVYGFHARKATRADGTRIGITRIKASSASDTGDVSVIVATASGALSDDDLTEARAYLNANAAPMCITLTVANGSTLLVPVTYQAWYRRTEGVTAAAVVDAIGRALAGFFAARPIGGEIIPPSSTGYVYVSGLRAAIVASHPAVFHAAVSSPAGDVPCASGSVPALGAITSTVTEVAE